MKYNWNNKTIKKSNHRLFFCPSKCVFINKPCDLLPIECASKEYYKYDKESSIFHL